MLQLLVSIFLNVIFVLRFLSLVKRLTTVAQMMVKQEELMVTKEY